MTIMVQTNNTFWQRRSSLEEINHDIHFQQLKITIFDESSEDIDW